MTHHDLVVLGAGSGNMVVDESFADLDVAIVEPGPFGGTCLDRGCIPSKMLAHTAALVSTVADADAFDIHVEGPPGLDWPALRERVFSRLDSHAEAAVHGRQDTPWITVYRSVEADMLLVAAGRVPNADSLDLDNAGVQVDDGGRVVVDDHQCTSADGVWALGDVCTPVPLKHVANREAEVVRHNLRHPDDLRTARHDLVPAAVFTSPQVASIGVTEQDLREHRVAHRVGVARYADIAYGWAMADPPGFCKVLAEPGDDGRILGAHLMGPQAATLIQPLVVAATLGISARTLLSGPYWIHPAMTEIVKQALSNLTP